MNIKDELFSLRHGEVLQVFSEQPTTGLWIAAMLRSVTMPEGDRQPVRQHDGAPVEQVAVVACHKVDGKWQWLQLSPATKEAIGDYLIDNGFERDQWNYATIAAEPKPA